MGWGVWSLAGPSSLGRTSITWTDGGRKQLWLRDIERSQRATATALWQWHNLKMEIESKEVKWKTTESKLWSWTMLQTPLGNNLQSTSLTWSQTLSLPSSLRHSAVLQSLTFPFFPFHSGLQSPQSNPSTSFPKTILTTFFWFLEAPKHIVKGNFRLFPHPSWCAVWQEGCIRMSS